MRTHFTAPCLYNEHKINLFRALLGCHEAAFYIRLAARRLSTDGEGGRAQIALAARSTPPELPRRVTWNERDGWR